MEFEGKKVMQWKEEDIVECEEGERRQMGGAP